MKDAAPAFSPVCIAFTALRRGGLALLLALVGAVATTPAHADGRYCSSRDAVQFGNRAVGTSTTANVTISNCGDRPWSFTGVSVHPATGPAFHVDTTCVTSLVLAAGQSCTIGIEFAPEAAGQTSGAVWLHNSTTVPDQLVTFYGRGIDAQAATSTLVFSPASAAFAAQALGTQSAPLPVELTNLGPAPLTPSAIVINGPAAYDFPGAADTCRVGTAIPVGESCRISISFGPQGVGARYASLVIDAAQLASLAILPISGVGVKAVVDNASGMWWNAPANSESGWGINFAHQNDTIFATWFTFGLDGRPLWLVVAATKTAPNVYSGTLYTGTGPAFDASPFDPALVTRTPVGLATFTFSDANNAAFAYTVNGISQTKAITREAFASPVPTCTWGEQSNLALATNFQDLWWATPAGSESGWGLSLTQQGDTIFAAWFTFGRDGKPLWLVAAAARIGPDVYAGKLYTGTGPAFNSAPFDSSKVIATEVGNVTLTFADGNNATFAYTVNGITQGRSITREVFAPPGTVCK
jgi:hypothetical protein